MSLLIKLNEATAARRRVPVSLVDDTDGKTGETAITISAGDLKMSKNGAAEANHGGTLTELAAGDYYYELSAGEVDTLGYLTGRVTKAGVRVYRFAVQVVAFDPYAVLSTLTAAQSNAEVDTAIADAQLATAADLAEVKNKTDSLTFTGAGRVDANIKAVNDSITGIDKLSAHLPAVLKVIIGAGASTTSILLNAATGIDGAAPSAIDNFYNGRVLVFTSGALAGQATSISDYVGATVTLTVVALTSAPSAGDTAVMV